MLADFVRCTHNGTGGSGTLTLVKLTGYPQPTNPAGTSGTRRIGYVISEWTDSTKTVPVQAEAGTGLLNLSTNVLTRDQVLETWVDGTPGTQNTANPTALTFGNTAANIDITMTATARSLRPALPAIPSGIGADTPYVPFNTRMALDTNASGMTLTTGRRYYLPVEFAYGKPISTVAVNATSVATTGNVRLSVYEWGADGLPGNLITEFTASSQIGINTATGIKSLTLGTPFWLPPGWYYVMVQADAAVQLTMSNPYSNCGAGVHGSRDTMYLYKDATYGAAPSTDSGLTAVSRGTSPQLVVYAK